MTVATLVERRPATPAATITGALLLPQDRIAREALGPWARRLRGELERAFAAGMPPRELARTVAVLANNTALVATHRGRGALARRLCEAQFRWQAALARHAGDPAITVCAVQPWVNLARLDAQEGEWERALARLARVEQLRAHGEVVLDGVRVGPRAWEGAGVPRETHEETLLNQYVIDSLKVLLANGRFREILDGVVRVDPGAPRPLAAVAAEVGVVAACRLGDFEGAVRAAREGSRTGRGWTRAGFQLRLAEALACGGDARAAVAVAAPLAGVLARHAAGATPSLNALHLLARAASLALELELHAAAGALAEQLRAGAAALRDEAIHIEALRLLVRVQGTPAQVAELARMQEETAYPRLRAPGAPEAECAEADALFGELAERLCGAEPVAR